MSTINAQNYGDGTDSVPASAVLQGTAKAWVNFDGTGTVAVRDSYNVSGLTDNGTGDYTVSYSNAFANNDYAPHVTIKYESSGFGSVTASIRRVSNALTTGSSRFECFFGSSDYDCEIVSVTSRGDLA